jgi:hypothetical protein
VVLERRGSGAEAGARARAGDGRSGVEVGEAGSRPEADACPAREARERDPRERHAYEMHTRDLRVCEMHAYERHASMIATHV